MKEQFKIKTIKYFVGFLVIMFLLTFFSRMLYVSKLPKVTTVGIKNQGLNHNVQCRGILDSSRKIPVFAHEGIIISEIYVNKGDQVFKGDCLMKLDTQYIAEKILSLEKEINSQICNTNGTYTDASQIPVFTQPELRIFEVYVKQGDYVESGQMLLRLDEDYLNSYIADLQDKLNADYITRDRYYEDEDYLSVDIISNNISEKERRIQKYYDILNNGGIIYSNISGTVTEISAKAGAVTDDSAVLCISESAELQYSIQEMQKRLDKLKTLQSEDGKIISPVDGFVSEILLNVGDITLESSVMIISDNSSGLIFTATINEKDMQFISIGDVVNLNFRNGKIHLDNCEIKRIFQTNVEGEYSIEIPIESDVVTVGEIGEMSALYLSEEQYSCVPESSVTINTEKRGYIYVIEESEGFLGPEYIVHMINVNIGDKNDNYYGLTELGLDTTAKIVSYSSKKLYDGQKVRLK